MDKIIDEIIVASIKQLGETNGTDFFQEILELFTSQGQQLTASIRQYALQKDVVQTKQVTHSLKGASANMGAVKLTEICHQIEKKALSNDFTDLENILSELDDCFRLSLQELKKHL